MLLHHELKRLVGHNAVSGEWSGAALKHYLAMPSDARYQALSHRIVREVDPRFVGDDLMKAMAIKQYLEKNGTYSLHEKTLQGADPTGKFLFGELRGYCVHFAHAAALLFRSQGIPSRVALGYATQTNRHGAGASLLLFSNEAHAWPEIYLSGVGWITFDIYPEKSDEPPQPPFDQDLESLLGELAHKDKTGGKAKDRGAYFIVPWRALRITAIGLFFALGAAAYLVKAVRRRRSRSVRELYVGALDRLADVGNLRGWGETREEHAQRLSSLAPSFSALTAEHLRAALGRSSSPALEKSRALAQLVRQELQKNLSRSMRILGQLNPLGWLWTR